MFNLADENTSPWELFAEALVRPTSHSGKQEGTQVANLTSDPRLNAF